MEDGKSKALCSIFLSSILDVAHLRKGLLEITFLDELIHDAGIDIRRRIG
jgi:hypothetical protein